MSCSDDEETSLCKEKNENYKRRDILEVSTADGDEDYIDNEANSLTTSNYDINANTF